MATNKVIHEVAYKNHDEWLAIRRKYIGGSDASAVIGMNAYKSAYTLWAEKTGKIPEFEGNLITKVGAYLEELVAQLFTEETGKAVRKKNKTILNDNYPFACANLDRVVVGENAFLEIKTTNNFPLMRTLRNSNEFPEAYYCQCVHYMAVTGLKKCYLAVLINCRDIKIYELERDEDEINALMTAEAEFWKLVENGTPPSTDGTISTAETLNTLYPFSTDDSIDVTPYNAELKNYLAISGEIKALKAQRDEYANRVKAYMQNAGRGETEDFRVSWKSSPRRVFDIDRFAAEHADIKLDDYYKETISKTFRVTEKNKKE